MHPDLLVTADFLEDHDFPTAAYLRREPTFLTGSRAYGTPRYGSDVDVVALVDEATMAVLKEFLHYKGMRKMVSIHSGRLNLLCTSDYEVYCKWRTVTDELIARKPVTKAQAIAAFVAELGEGLHDQDPEIGWDDS